MIIRSLSIQSHDNSGADVFKLMIISVCCIQTQLIVFMPNAAEMCVECILEYIFLGPFSILSSERLVRRSRSLSRLSLLSPAQSHIITYIVSSQSHVGQSTEW